MSVFLSRGRRPADLQDRLFILRGIRLLLPPEPVVQQVSRCPLVMLRFSDWGLFARLVSEIVNRSPCLFQLLRQGFLSHSGPLPGLDLVFCRADPVLSIRRYDVNRYTCFLSEFLFGPLNLRAGLLPILMRAAT